jgi:hypothetical protein
MMRYGFICAFVLLGLVGCYNEDKFADDFSTEACAKATECESMVADYYVNEFGMDADTAASSAKAITDAYCATSDAEGDDDTSSDCAFNSANAKDCVDGISAATCEESAMGWTMPDSCTNVCE